MKILRLAVIGVLSAIPTVANAGFMTGAVVGAAAGRMSCSPCEKTLVCISQKLADPAWKGKESQVVEYCETENHHRVTQEKPAVPSKQ